MTSLTPVRFTPEALDRLAMSVADNANFKFNSSFNWFGQINYFQPDGSAHIELGGSETKSGSPFTIDFEAEDFEYEAV